MKTTFSSKVVALLCTAILLFACSEIDDLNLDYEYAKTQEVSDQVDEETFVSLDKATAVADLFFSKLTESNVSTRSGLKAQKGSALVETLRESSNPLMYIINYPDGGFVIMGTTKNYYPVLAYSDKNSFEITPDMDGISDWLEETKEAIKTSDALNDTIKTAMQNLWKSYETADISSPREAQDARLKSASNGQIACWNRCDELQMQYMGEGWNFLPLSQTKQIFEDAGFFGVYEDLCYGAEFNKSPFNCSVVGWRNIYKNEQVGPLLSTQWHQNPPFNDLCDGHSAGCGAIAVAQVMKYYQYPSTFTLNGYTFNWNNIPVSPKSGSDQAALVRLVGGFVNVHYDSFGSWATPGDMESGIRLLGYNVTRASHNYESVEKQLLTYKRPVIMGGNATNLSFLPGSLEYIGNSHYWICDGARRLTTNQIEYFTEWQPNGNGVFTPGWNSINSPGLLGGIVYLYFHMNWGWGGKNDAWFAFNDVNSGNGNYQHSRQNFYITKP
ncbi:MAG: C10 family peptidase [Dysgonomonas sp.]|uniref:C10 family peptidase n=1 Tax=Dysgonomonas sp. TaxID=1891233 RepID=UPI003A88DDDF